MDKYNYKLPEIHDPPEQCSFCGKVVLRLNALGYCGTRCTESAEGPQWRTKLASREERKRKKAIEKAIIGTALFILFFLVLGIILKYN